MKALTRRQSEILEFIQSVQQQTRSSPTLREIAAHFRFKSMNAALSHVAALRQKGVLESTPRRARALCACSPLEKWRRRVVEIPVYGSIPAGRPEDRQQEAQGCISIDIETIGVRPGPRTFALEVQGDSMIGKHILEGDYVILEHGKTPRAGDVVAALVDNESTLKTYLTEKGRPYLKAENPRYPKLIPAQELVIQGVMVALIRKQK